MARFLFVLSLFMLALTAPARADFIDGSTLRLYCASSDPVDDSICIVYITGAVDAFTTNDLLAQAANGDEAKFCVPDGTGPDALKSVVKKWLARPESDLELGATLLILGAIDDAYAC